MYVARADSGGLDFKIIYLSNCELINYQNVKKKDYFFPFDRELSPFTFGFGFALFNLVIESGVSNSELGGVKSRVVSSYFSTSVLCNLILRG